MLNRKRSRRAPKALHQFFRWVIPSLLIAWGIYYLMGAIQSASFSVAAQPAMSEIYKTRAMLSLPISALMVAVGIVLYIVIGPWSDDSRE
jgi:hypothetical protein